MNNNEADIKTMAQEAKYRRMARHFLQRLGNKIKVSGTSLYESVDMRCTGWTTTMDIEIKESNNPKFPNTALLKVEKFNRMKERQKNNKLYLFTFYPYKNEVTIFDLDKLINEDRDTVMIEEREREYDENSPMVKKECFRFKTCEGTTYNVQEEYELESLYRHLQEQNYTDNGIY